MGSKSKKAPAAPDYTKLAQEQARLANELADKQTANNRVNQTNPLGSITWQQDPATGQWSQVESWSPEIMAAFNDENTMRQLQLAMAQKQSGFADKLFGLGDNQISYANDQMDFNRLLMGFGGEQMDFARDQMGFARKKMDAADGLLEQFKTLQNGPAFSGGPALPSYDASYGGAYATDFMKSALARVLPQQAREQEALTNKLRLQGLQPGTEAFNSSYTNMLTAHGDVQSKAAIDGMMAGSQAARDNYLAQLQGQNQGFNQSLQSYLLPFQTAQMSMGLINGLGEGIGNGIGNGIGTNIGSGYGQGIGQGIGISQGVNGSAPPDFQSFMPAGGYQTPEILNAAQQQYAQAMQKYNEEQQRKSSKGGSIGSLVGAVGGTLFGAPSLGASIGGGLGSAFSDLRLKHDVQPMDDRACYEKMKGIIPITWKWNGTSIEDAGISAQQIAEEMPELISYAERGLMRVNYTALFAMLLGAFRHLSTMQESENHNAAV